MQLYKRCVIQSSQLHKYSSKTVLKKYDNFEKYLCTFKCLVLFVKKQTEFGIHKDRLLFYLDIEFDWFSDTKWQTYIITISLLVDIRIIIFM